jgi:hypothetical protein
MFSQPDGSHSYPTDILAIKADSRCGFFRKQWGKNHNKFLSAHLVFVAVFVLNAKALAKVKIS